MPFTSMVLEQMEQLSLVHQFQALEMIAATSISQNVNRHSQVALETTRVMGRRSTLMLLILMVRSMDFVDGRGRLISLVIFGVVVHV